MLLNESPGPFSQIAGELPRMNGKRISVTTLWRWTVKGINGVTLEAIKLGGRYLTSTSAVERFGKKLSELGVQERGPRLNATLHTPRRRTDAQRQRDVGKAEAELQRAGI